MARWREWLRMLALNSDLAWAQLRSDPRFVCLTAFGVVIGTAVLAAAMGIAAMAEGRLQVIREEIGTQVVYLTVASSTPAEFQRKHGRLLDEQALAALGASTGTFKPYAAYLRGTAQVGDLGEQKQALVIGFDGDDVSALGMELASGTVGAEPHCYLDASSVPLTRPRTVNLGDSHCVVGGTFWRKGFLSALLNAEASRVVLTPFDQAFAVLGRTTPLPPFVVAFKLNSEADAPQVLAVLGAYMQAQHPGVQFSLEWPGSRLVPLNALLDQIRLVAVLVGALIMLISAVAMANAMLAQIGQRRREFGIRLAIGATPQDLIWQTLFEVLGIFGGGLLVGFSIAGAIMYAWCLISGWAFALAPSLFVINAFVAFVCAVCSALYPALSAARIEPIEAMQAS